MYFEKFTCFFLRLPKISKKTALNLKEYILMEITRYEKQFKNLLLKVMLSETKPKESGKNLCFFCDCQIFKMRFQGGGFGRGGHLETIPEIFKIRIIEIVSSKRKKFEYHQLIGSCLILIYRIRILQIFGFHSNFS